MVDARWARYVEGIHGRYFLPLLPLLLIMIGCNRLVLSESTRTILTIAAPIYINLVALATLLDMYFVTRRAFLLSSAFLVCCLPLLVFGLPLLIREGLRGSCRNRTGERGCVSARRGSLGALTQPRSPLKAYRTVGE